MFVFFIYDKENLFVQFFFLPRKILKIELQLRFAIQKIFQVEFSVFQSAKTLKNDRLITSINNSQLRKLIGMHKRFLLISLVLREDKYLSRAM